MNVLLAAALLLPLGLRAQTAAPTPAPAPSSSQTSTQKPLLQVKLPAGTYQVASGAIIAVASHEYLVDGAARVTEVNVDTAGSLLARFYYIEPNTPQSPIGLGTATIEKAQQMLKEGAASAGQDSWKRVIKNYPTTTHARTVEYRVVNKEDLQKIFEAADEAFRFNRNKSVTISE
ncbi:MAG: hypothetical protein M3463_06370 [Verrucomicrobiota bacterium]|nr:hypothetical protein [Verrucomicrobiota bacterium]